MTGYPNGLHYPQPPRYPNGPVALDALPRPSWPAPIRWAVFLMYVGAAAGLVTGIVRGLTMSLVESIAYTSPTTGTARSSKSLLAGIIEGLWPLQIQMTNPCCRARIWGSAARFSRWVPSTLVS